VPADDLRNSVTPGTEPTPSLLPLGKGKGRKSFVMARPTAPAPPLGARQRKRKGGGIKRSLVSISTCVELAPFHADAHRAPEKREKGTRLQPVTTFPERSHVVCTGKKKARESAGRPRPTRTVRWRTRSQEKRKYAARSRRRKVEVAGQRERRKKGERGGGKEGLGSS